jgi:L-ascorbate metabolism protein UlaG (beta-lactamase superfamily)
MRMTTYGHACVRLEAAGAALVIDPGVFSDAGTALAGADAALITHEHADHVDAAAVKAAVDANPALAVFAHPDVVAQLGDLGGAARQVRSGETFTAAGFEVTAVGDRHAFVHDRAPDIPNLGYLVAGQVYHPGDAFFVPDRPVPRLLLPVSAPWLKLGEAIDFAASVAAERVHPIHDAILADVGLGMVDRWLQQSQPGYARLPVGEPVDF